MTLIPDSTGFNLLGTEVACIEEGCEVRGMVWEWPEKARARHAIQHQRDRAKAADRRRRESARRARLLAAQAARENAVAYGEGVPT